MQAPPSGIALFGYYRSAVEVASYLRSGAYRLVIIDDHPGNLEKARKAGYETAELDFRNDSELAKLGLGETIDTIFCLFPDDAESPHELERELTFQEATHRFQRDLVERVLRECGWNVAESARRLDVARSHVYNLIRMFEIRRG